MRSNFLFRRGQLRDGGKGILHTDIQHGGGEAGQFKILADELRVFCSISRRRRHGSRRD